MHLQQHFDMWQSGLDQGWPHADHRAFDDIGARPLYWRVDCGALAALPFGSVRRFNAREPCFAAK